MKFPRLAIALGATLVALALCAWWWLSVDRSVVASAHGKSAAPRAFPSLPRDRVGSPHPVEDAVARGEIISEKIEPTDTPGKFRRIRLAQTPVQPRRVRIVETWETNAAGVAICTRRDMYLADQLIVKTAVAADEVKLREFFQQHQLHSAEQIAPQTWTVRTQRDDIDASPDGVSALQSRSDLIAVAEADGVGFGGATPNDLQFGNQWGFANTGQSGGTVGADVSATAFWDVAGDTPGLVIAVLDSGLNFTHPDLVGIAWTNPGEIAGDGIDNDGSGKIDDVVGWDFVNNDNDPTDDLGHGSNVTGIIAANRNDGIGVAGLLNGVKILTCKILNSSNSGSTSNLISATTYARQRGARIMNMSLQSYPFSSTLSAEFTTCETAGILLSICAGNQGVNNDVTPNYPSSYPHTNIIAVGNHDRTDQRWNGGTSNFNPSNYGATTVDLFAPGRDILSPILGTGYSYYTGTSQATPFVTAVAGALLYANPTWKAADLKAAILGSVVLRPAYDGLCVTGGRLNALNALGTALAQQPATDTDGDGYSNFFEFLAGTRMDSRSSVPTPTTDFTNNTLRLRLPRVTRTQGRFEIETSPDLQTWTKAGITDLSSTNELAGSIPLTGDPARGFLRIKAANSP